MMIKVVPIAAVLAALLAVTDVAGQTAQIQTLPFQAGSINNYTINYIVQDLNLTNPTFNATLSIQNLNTSSWIATDGSQGLYLALGYMT